VTLACTPSVVRSCHGTATIGRHPRPPTAIPPRRPRLVVSSNQYKRWLGAVPASPAWRELEDFQEAPFSYLLLPPGVVWLPARLTPDKMRGPLPLDEGIS